MTKSTLQRVIPEVPNEPAPQKYCCIHRYPKFTSENRCCVTEYYKGLYGDFSDRYLYKSSKILTLSPCFSRVFLAYLAVSGRFQPVLVLSLFCLHKHTYEEQRQN